MIERPVSIPEDLPDIEADITASGAALVIIDPLMAFLSGGIDGHKDQDVRRAMAALKMMAERTGVSVVLVRHLNKAQGSSALYRGGGSIGLIGAARFGLLVARDPDDADRRLIAITKTNLSVEADTLAYRLESVEGTDVARVLWDGTSSLRADELVRPPEDEEERQARDHAAEFLRDALAHGPRPAKDVERDGRAADLTPKQLRTARAKCGVISRKSSLTGPWVWELPAEDAQPVTEDAQDALLLSDRIRGHLGHLRSENGHLRDETDLRDDQSAPAEAIPPPRRSYRRETCIACGDPLPADRVARCQPCTDARVAEQRAKRRTA